MKRLKMVILVGGGAACISLILWLSGMLDRWEFATWALRVKYFAGRSTVSKNIKVILLDQASLDWGKEQNQWSWPWPREVYGPILGFCKRGGARAIAFDVLYTEPSVYGVGDDAALGAEIGRIPAVACAVFLSDKTGQYTTWMPGLTRRSLSIENLESWMASANRDKVRMPFATFPITEVATNATLLGNVSDTPDPDGVFRRASLFKVFDGHVIPSLGLAAFLCAEPDPRLRIEDGWLTVKDRRIPIDDQGSAILRFLGTTGAHETYSAAGVIQSELLLQAGQQPSIDPGVFKDSYVFFGLSAPGLLDLRPSPISRVYPGVEIHATVLDDLLSLLFLRDAPGLAVVLTTVVLALLAGSAVIFSRKVWQSVTGFIVFLPLPALAGFAGYALGIWWPIMVSGCAVVFALVGAMIVNYATEGRQKAFIKNAFRFYLSPQVVEQLLDNPDQLRLGGEKREMSIFFSDIEKFSTFSERLDPPTLTSLLNDYLSDMTDIIMEEGGTLDKYIGDAIVAFWNAPVGQTDHAVRACRAALRCQRKLAERRNEFEQRTGGALIKMRIGINTGEVVVGNMGSGRRFNYTVLGDAANLASRLEGANKAFGSYMLVSESTWKHTGGQYAGRELGRIRVVGREEPVTVYELVGQPGEQRPSWYADFEGAVGLFYAGKLADAENVFQGLPEDPASRVYIERCRLMQGTVPAGWDGVLNLTEKG